jgi:hypothetical protein
MESVAPLMESVGPVIEQPTEAAWPEAAISEPVEWSSSFPTATGFDSSPIVESVAEPVIESPVIESVSEPFPLAEIEPIGQGQPIPYQTPAWEEKPAPQPIVDTAPFAASIAHETSLHPTITPVVTMPEPIQIPTVRPAAGSTPQPAGAMHTAVQLTFMFEIASMQLTSTFKMGALQVRPTSKIVTMRLAPSAQPQPAMNLQVTFEIAKIQPTGGALGSIRLTPTQQQRPAATGSPSFTVAGLQLVPNFEAAPLQLTPSGHGASVLVTIPFQIATVEFSPSFEIASIALNSSSKQALVQLPGPAPTAGEASPMFEIANLQLTGSGEIGMMQLNLLGAGSRRG